MTREEREAFFAERAANLQAKRERDVAKKEAKAETVVVDARDFDRL